MTRQSKKGTALSSPETEEQKNRNAHKRNLSLFQFGIKQLLIAMVGVSIMCGVFVAVLNRVPEESRATATIFVFCVLALCLFVLILISFQRARLEKKAGPRHYVAMGSIGSSFHVSGIFCCVAILGIFAYLLYIAVSTDELSIPQPLHASITGTWFCGTIAARYLFCVFWWKSDPQCIDVRENGVIHGLQLFFPWSKLRGYRWNQFTKKLMLLTEDNFFEYTVPQKHHDEVSAAIEKFIPHQPV